MTATRREFLRHAGLASGLAPFLGALGSPAFAAEQAPRQRLIVMFSPNGVVPKTFWPDQEGELELKQSLEPLTKLRDRTMTIHGLCDRVRGDGDSHMRGIGCLLTGTELFPGNIQGGSHTPAGWSTGISIDQEIKNKLQSHPSTRTRFGSLEFGVMVPERADTWTRMVYAGGNRPIAPIDDPYLMFRKLYGNARDQAIVGSVLDDVLADLNRLRTMVDAEDRDLLDRQSSFIRDMEQEIKDQRDQRASLSHAAPELPPGVKDVNDSMPEISKMQIDLLVHSLAADFARVATLQFTNSVGQARMKWLGIDDGHHSLSHEGDDNDDAQDKLTRINRWYCEQLAYLAQQLADTPEPHGEGSMLDHTLIVWTNELGKGNSHTLDNIPFVLVGGAPGFRMGRAVKLQRTPHNRFLLSLSQMMGHPLETFGNSQFCSGGPLVLS
ncbi:MAG: DUF1552 domain-containing protein [Planctomycetales bacterium]|nr:DUF1552 domain-containing protein [Planctomycetales bacterium]